MVDDINWLENYRARKIIVLGLGKSGLSVIRKLSVTVGGLSVVAVDSNPALDIESHLGAIEGREDFRLEIRLDEYAGEKPELLDGAGLLIISPGVPQEHGLIRSADILGIPVISELEFGWRFLDEKGKRKTIAVTGTNGKTTVVTLTQQILDASGINSIVCGNIGNPLTNASGPGYSGDPVRIIEVSSFQLERIIQFNPFAGIVLNITSDHMDRHYSMENYAEIKFRLFKNSCSGQWGIFNADDDYINAALEKQGNYKERGLNVLQYSLVESKAPGLYYSDGKIFYDIMNGNTGSIDISGSSLAGKHNISNIMACIAAAKIFGADDNLIKSAIETFKTLEHRIEFVAEVDGRRVFNDSKATNPDATIQALKSFKKEVTLILGGKDKDMDFNIMVPAMEEAVENVILIGETGPRIGACLEEYPYSNGKMPFSVFYCRNFKDAVDKCFEVSSSGKVILLSPACASFDMFTDYKDRGNQFKSLVYKKAGIKKSREQYCE
jgi:UDP-N-acetylmuramoylalanine--D-glutamate ligase